MQRLIGRLTSNAGSVWVYGLLMAVVAISISHALRTDAATHSRRRASGARFGDLFYRLDIVALIPHVLNNTLAIVLMSL
jgi:hypothetical protein